MYLNIVLLLSLMIFRIGSSQDTAPELCDESLKGKNMIDHIFNIRDDIYVTRKEWIFKLKRFMNDPNNGQMIQNGKTMKTDQLFPGLTDIFFGVTLPIRNADCGNDQQCHDEVNSHGYAYVIFKHINGQWSFYYPDSNGTFVKTPQNRPKYGLKFTIDRFDNPSKHFAGVSNGAKVCALTYDPNAEIGYFLTTDNFKDCKGTIGAFWYASDATGKRAHFLLNQQLYQNLKLDGQNGNAHPIMSNWGREHWNLFRCNGNDNDTDDTAMTTAVVIKHETTAATAAATTTINTKIKTEGDSTDSSSKSGNLWIYIIIVIIILAAMIGFIIVVFSKKRENVEVSREKSVSRGNSVSSIASNVSTQSVRSNV